MVKSAYTSTMQLDGVAWTPTWTGILLVLYIVNCSNSTLLGHADLSIFFNLYVANGDSSYATASSISASTHRLTNTNPLGVFGAISYGWGSNYNAYPNYS